MLLRCSLLVGLCLVALVQCEEEEVIKCPGGECVKLHLCPNGELSTDGANIIDIRFNPDNDCEDYLLKCCPIPEEEDEVIVPPASVPNGPPAGEIKPPSGHGPDPHPDSVSSHPHPQGTGPSAGPANGAGSGDQGSGGIGGPAPATEGKGSDNVGGSSANGGGNGAGNPHAHGHHGCSGYGGCQRPHSNENDEQSQLVGAETITGPNRGVVAANQVQETVKVPKPQGTGPAAPGGNAGPSSGGPSGVKGSKPGGDIPPPDVPGLGLGSIGQPVTTAKPGSADGARPNTGHQGQLPGSPNAGSTSGSVGGGGPVRQPGQQVGDTGSKQPNQNVPVGVNQPGGGTGSGGAGPAHTGNQGHQPGSSNSGPTKGSVGGGVPLHQPGQHGVGTESHQPNQNVPAGGIHPVGGAGSGGAGPAHTGNQGQQVTAGPSTGSVGGGVQQPGQQGVGTGSKQPNHNVPVGVNQPPGGTGNQGHRPESSNTNPSTGNVGGGGSVHQPGQQGVGTGSKQPSEQVPVRPSQTPGGTGIGAAEPTKTHKHSTIPKDSHKGAGTNITGLPSSTDRPVTVPQKCGERNADGVGFRITGNNDGESEYGEFPWMVAILKEEKALDQVINVYQCGGSLIHPSVVLTAAHCIQNRQAAEIKVRLGEWDTQTKNEIYDYQDRNVVEMVAHAEFYKGGLFNDVALLFLDKPAELMDTVSTICLPPANFNFDLSRCFASGWGKDVFGKQGTYQVILKKIELPIMARDVCQKALRTTRLGSRFKLHSSFICAGGEKGRDTCKGDGGSPLVCPIPGTVNQYYQAGMVAWGIGCGEDGIPGVYVNVPLFRGWIDQQLTQRSIPHTYYIHT